MKDNAVYTIVEEHPVPQHRNILKDQTICPTGVAAVAKCPLRLRRIEVWHPAKEEVLVFLTNQFRLGATTIAPIYNEFE